MKIKDIRAVVIDAKPELKTQPTAQKRETVDWVNPMQRYHEFQKKDWINPWKMVICVVTAEDGTWGMGATIHSEPVLKIINDKFSPILLGQNCMATEKLWDIMRRVSVDHGATGLASYAISAVDNALWDLKGKILNCPVYELLGGPQKDKIFCYASNTDISYGAENSIEWFLQLGFKAVKLFLPNGPEKGIKGLNQNEQFVRKIREQIGDDVELMVDAWMSLDIEYLVKLSEILQPYKIKWIEDYFLPEDMESYFKVRDRIPGQILASGEHWNTIHPFTLAAKHGLVDILQPDVQWVGGITASVRICHIAEAHGLTVIGHAGMNFPWGQHLAYSMPAITWGERSEGVAPPGVPLQETVVFPGTSVIKDGFLIPNNSPGVGLEIDIEWLENKAI